MRKGNGKKTLRAVLAAALGAVLLMSLAWAGVTDVTGGSNTIVNTTVEEHYTDTYETEQPKALALTKGANTFAGMGAYMGDGEADQMGGTLAVQFDGLDTPVNIAYSVANDELTMTVTNYDQLPDGVYSGEVETRMTTTYTGSRLEYTGTDYEEDGSTVRRINETRHDYYNRHHWKVTLTLTVSHDANKVEAIYVNDAALTFQVGEAPRFTGTVPEGACYTLARQSWFEDKEGGKGVTTDPNYTEYVGKELTAFAAGQRYSYLAKITPQDGYTVTDDCRYFLNGQEVLVRTESGSQDEPFVRRFDDGEYFFAHMTPQKAQPEQPEQPEKPDNRGSGYSGPYVTTLLTAPDAKSATDYSGGIYGLTFRANTPFSGFLGVQVDGKTIDQSCYIAEENGGTEIYLKAVYLQTLAAGKHTMTVLSSAGDATTEFTIGGLNTAPKTFDAGVAVYGVTAVLSLGGMAWMGKKKEF